MKAKEKRKSAANNNNNKSRTCKKTISERYTCTPVTTVTPTPRLKTESKQAAVESKRYRYSKSYVVEPFFSVDFVTMLLLLLCSQFIWSMSGVSTYVGDVFFVRNITTMHWVIDRKSLERYEVFQNESKGSQLKYNTFVCIMRFTIIHNDWVPQCRSTQSRNINQQIGQIDLCVQFLH